MMVCARLFVAVGLVLVSVWDSTAGLRCTMNCATMQCSPPKGPRCEPVFKPCECCPVCASDRGQPCGGIAAPCMKRLWCIHATATTLEAKRNPKWPDPFRGVCGRMFVHTRWHYRRYHHIPHHISHRKPHHPVHNKHHREWRGKKVYIAK